MTVRTELPAPIFAPSRSRHVSGHSGPALVAVVWMLALAFFVFAVAVPAAVMERRVQEERVARAEP